MNSRVLSYLSICMKAGKVVTGEDRCEKAIAGGNAVVVIIAEDASDNTKKKFLNKAKYYEVPVFVTGNREAISQAIGKMNRPTVVIMDRGLGSKIIELLKLDVVPQQ